MAAEIRFYLDEHIPAAVAEGLRRRGIDALATLGAGQAGSSDRDQLGFAQRHGRVFVTHDADFLRLHNEGAGHAGIVYCHPNARTIGEILKGIILIHALLSPEDMVQHIEFL